MAGPGVISLTRTEKYSSLVAEELKEMRDARVFSDFKICIKDQNIPCHRLVLSVHSAMLKAMLTSDMAEAAKHSVNLDHVDLSIMKVILDYMYIGEISFQADQLKDMIIASDYLRIPLLKDMCVDRVPSVLEPVNAIPWLKLAHQYDLIEVKSQCLEIIGASFTTISRQPDYVDLSFVHVEECLDHAQQANQKGDDVLNAALRWVDHDSTGRRDHVESLVTQVHLDQCSPQGILGVMKTYKTIVTATDTLYDHLTSAGASSKVKPPSKATLVVIGGQEDEDVSRVWWKLNEDKQLEEMHRIPFDDLESRHNVCKTTTGFIISGGVDSTLCIKFDAETKNWCRLQNMMIGRYRHGSVCIRGVLYVMGGTVQSATSKSVHSLVVEGGEWEEESDLPNSMTWPKLAELADSVFLFNENTGQLFQLDVDQKVWSKKASLLRKKYHGASMVIFSGKLYVAAEQLFAWYTPATDTWIEGQKPNKRHRYGSLVPYNGKLLLLGGSHLVNTNEIEEVDIKEETWSVCARKMPASLFNHHALVLDFPEYV